MDMKPLLVTVSIIAVATLTCIAAPILGISSAVVVLAAVGAGVALALYVSGVF